MVPPFLQLPRFDEKTVILLRPTVNKCPCKTNNDNKHLNNSYYVSDIVLGTLHALSDLSFKTLMKYTHLCFTDNDWGIVK